MSISVSREQKEKHTPWSILHSWLQ